MRLAHIRRLFYFLIFVTSAVFVALNTASLKPRRNTAKYETVADIVAPKCEVIHIVIVCDDHRTVRTMATLMKSILSYRNDPLHFHFLADDTTMPILKTLFDTWNIPQVDISIYSIEKAMKLFPWPSIHKWRIVHLLLKLMFPLVLPDGISQVIFIDSDMAVLTDIAALWKHFRIMNSQKHAAIGLVDSLLQNDRTNSMYSDRDWKTDVILFHLTRLHQIAWVDMLTNVNWLAEFERNGNHSSLVAMDRDIFMAISKHYPDLVYALSSQWSISLKGLYAGDTMRETSETKIFHMHSTPIWSTSTAQAEYLQDMYATFLGMNGNLLRHPILRCASSSPSQPPSTIDLLNRSDTCYTFYRERYVVRRTHIYFLPFQYIPIQNDVTLVAQMSIDRIHMLHSLCSNWDGPMSIAFYLSDAEAQQLFHYIRASPLLMLRKNIGFHVVFKEGELYPINYLRNVALDNVLTPYIYTIDVDFLPMPHLDEYLRTFLSENPAEPNKKKAFIVPAFETLRHHYEYPTSKRKLLQLVQENVLQPFHQQHWKLGHRAMNYPNWMLTGQPYTVKWELHFEPYIVVPRDVVRYDERFLGYGWNKVSHILELNTQGYEFVVLPDVFMIHVAHAPSIDDTKYRSNTYYRICLIRLKNEFLRDIKRKYSTAGAG